MQVPVYSLSGEVAEQVELDEDIFGLPFNRAVVHQALVRQLANKRQGSASTKSRSEVSGSTRKLYAQKHTGRARRGSIKSPLLVGGGVVFGPKPRSYRQAMPRKMRRLALKCVLSAKVRQGNMKVIRGLDFEEPATKEMRGILSALGIDSPVLIVTAPPPNPNVIKSADNLASVKVLPAALINIFDLISHQVLMITVPAIRQIEQIWGRKETEKEVPGNSENSSGKSRASV
jgi:large subunit ribosomal protein L4